VIYPQKLLGLTFNTLFYNEKTNCNHTTRIYSLRNLLFYFYIMNEQEFIEELDLWIKLGLVDKDLKETIIKRIKELKP
jgi:hypothetical protein